MEIRLIAADMDGTLLDDEKGIPEENLRAFRACAAQGIEIVPGRQAARCADCRMSFGICRAYTMRSSRTGHRW